MTCFKGKKIHFIGIGGVGVNALAHYVSDEGGIVSGSDARLNRLCMDLQQTGAYIYEGVNPVWVDGVDEVVYSSAIKNDNPELACAIERGIPVFERQEFLHEIAGEYDNIIGIAGTHGKTTTTAMLSHILACQKRKFVAMIGGNSVKFGNYVNNSEGEKNIFVAEACEYKRNFLSLNPTVAVVTNIECDHPDCYRNYAEVKSAFDSYLAPASTKIYLKSDCKDRWEIVFSDNRISEVYGGELTKDGCELYCDGLYLGSIRLRDGGDYNFKNATFAVVAARAVGVTAQNAIRALASFDGVARRFEYAGKIDGVPVFFDFAHHPTEISCVIDRAGKYGRILAVFQPHTYSRTKAYFDDFVKVFGGNRNVGALVLMPTYAAREKFDSAYESDVLARAIVKTYGKASTYVAKDAKSTYEFVTKFAKSHDIILFIGAGDIYDIKADYFDK